MAWFDCTAYTQAISSFFSVNHHSQREIHKESLAKHNHVLLTWNLAG